MNIPINIIQLLLVEDNEDDILMIKDAFEGMNVLNILDVVRDGDEALDYLYKRNKYSNKKTPGMILMDINMPRKNGFEVLKAIKDNKALNFIPVVMLTTSKHEDDIVKSYNLGACSYISKPVEAKKFFEVIKQFSIYWALVSKIPNFYYDERYI